MSNHPRGKWKLSGNQGCISLITPAEFRTLPNNTELRSILNTKVVVGVDHIDQDTRSGYLAVGFWEPLATSS